jgi:hypothetical protein
MWASVRLSSLPGNLLALYLLEAEPEGDAAPDLPASNASSGEGHSSTDLVLGWKVHSPLFAAMACLVMFGSLMMCMVRTRGGHDAGEDPPPPPPASDNSASDSASPPTSAGSPEKDADAAAPPLLESLISLWRLIPLMLFSGLNGAFLFCVLPSLMPVLLVAKVSMIIAVVEFVMCFVYGRIADANGSGSVLVLSLCLELVSVVFLCFVAVQTTEPDFGETPDRELLWYAVTVMISAADAGWQSQTYSVIGSTGTGGRRVQAFAVFCVVQHIGFALAWGLVSLAPPSDTSTFCAYWITTAAVAVVAFCGWASNATMKMTQEELYEPLQA